jgi:hypothetical protein
MAKSIVPESITESYNLVEIADDEADELAFYEQLMLDRQDYYQLVADY